MTSDWLTIDQVAKKLQVPTSWVYERTRHHRIPFRKMGKYLRFNEAEIDQWVQQNCSLKIELNSKVQVMERKSYGLYSQKKK